jgi:2-oxoglutarate ferredoxin oxidoreductase subunit alpha
MLSLLKLDIEPSLVTRLRSIAHLDGLPIDARSVTDHIMTMEVNMTAVNMEGK